MLFQKKKKKMNLEDMSISTAFPAVVASSEFASILITGTNFVSPVYCQFGSSEYLVLASVIDSTQIRCVSPYRSPGEVILQVTRNFIEYFGNFIFTFRDPVSEFCRGWKGEFSFVSESQRAKGGFDSNGNFLYFPDNVASNQVVTVTQGTTSYFNALQVVDRDFCCELSSSLDGQGLVCGANFTENPAVGELTVSLRNTARVNQIIVSWGDPCNSLPPSYIVSSSTALNGPYSPIFTRNTGDSSACVSIPSDNGAASLCVDHFSVIDARYFRITFDTVALVYEFAIQGKYFDAPHSIGTSVSWSPTTTVPSALVTPLPSFNLELKNILGTNTIVTSTIFPIDVKLFYLVNSS